MTDTAPILSADDTADAVRHYLVTALWSSQDWDDQDDSGNPAPMDDAHDTDDVAPETWEQAEADLVAFVALAGPADVAAYLDAFGGDAHQLGHDLWLTRNGHGAGFWDRGLGELGDRLTAHAHSLGEVDLYVGDDGQIYGQ